MKAKQLVLGTLMILSVGLLSAQGTQAVPPQIAETLSEAVTAADTTDSTSFTIQSVDLEGVLTIPESGNPYITVDGKEYQLQVNYRAALALASQTAIEDGTVVRVEGHMIPEAITGEADVIRVGRATIGEESYILGPMFDDDEFMYPGRMGGQYAAGMMGANGRNFWNSDAQADFGNGYQGRSNQGFNRSNRGNSQQYAAPNRNFRQNNNQGQNFRPGMGYGVTDNGRGLGYGQGMYSNGYYDDCPYADDDAAVGRAWNNQMNGKGSRGQGQGQNYNQQNGGRMGNRW